jgi:SET domain-containing protein
VQDLNIKGQNFLVVRKAGHKGRGVFTSKEIKKGDIIEICPIIELSKKDHYMLIDNLLENYTFVWNTQKKSAAIVLGFGSLYNHSKSNNATYNKKIKENVMVFKATKNIAVNEEITIDYGDMHSDLS